MYFSQSEGTCVIHQIRNSLKYVISKDQKPFMVDFNRVSQTINKDQAEVNLQDPEENWGKKDPVVIDSGRRNWDKLTTYFRYPDASRKMIYATNTIEGYHRQIRKVTKSKGLLPAMPLHHSRSCSFRGF
jgi:putative transposase